MSGSGGPSTKEVDFQNTETHADPVDLRGEPAAGSYRAGVPTADDKLLNTRTRPAANNEKKPWRQNDLQKKVAIAAAVAAAGVAIVLGARKCRSTEDTESSAKRKIKQKVDELKKEAGKAGDRSEGLLSEAGDSISHAAAAARDKAKQAAHAAADSSKSAYESGKETLSNVPHKAREMQADAKEKVEDYTEAADARAANPAAELEQRRMTYGQDKHGVPKGLTADDGLFGFKKLWPFGKK